jgi:ABC-type nickel/cobalt efflux system permease component RcnA
VFDQDVGALYASAVRNAGSLRVASVATKEARLQRPPGLNTVELLKVASSALNIGPHTTMQVRRGRARRQRAGVVCSVGLRRSSVRLARQQHTHTHHQTTAHAHIHARTM